ncbi:MAG: hypothetical protein M1814_005280 [Vezdaea aestivalis]|nr:MAG: hypothetical protein M1814_005280 [Vezdaea aestivalis]
MGAQYITDLLVSSEDFWAIIGPEKEERRKQKSTSKWKEIQARYGSTMIYTGGPKSPVDNRASAEQELSQASKEVEAGASDKEDVYVTAKETQADVIVLDPLLYNAQAFEKANSKAMCMLKANIANHMKEITTSDFAEEYWNNIANACTFKSRGRARELSAQLMNVPHMRFTGVAKKAQRIDELIEDMEACHPEAGLPNYWKVFLLTYKLPEEYRNVANDIQQTQYVLAGAVETIGETEEEVTAVKEATPVAFSITGTVLSWHLTKVTPTDAPQSGLLNRTKTSPNTSHTYSHSSTPISSLKDPLSFGPPPKHVNYHRSAALPLSGLGKPLTSAQIAIQDAERQESEVEIAGPASLATPYRSDTSGLKIPNLPPPPIRKAISKMPPPPSSPPYPSTPALPPRMSQRVASAVISPPLSERAIPTLRAPTSSTESTSRATHRLAAAGISVPDLDISKTFAAQELAPTELSARRSTTFQQKRAAVTTASRLRSDPSAVSFAETRDAALTANSFRQRHGQQMVEGAKKATELKEQYGIIQQVESTGTGVPENGVTAVALAAKAKKKPPPPPPPKKKGLGEMNTRKVPPAVPEDCHRN